MVGANRGTHGDARHEYRVSPFICYHASARRNRDGILRDGLLPGQPSECQPSGVYAFSPHLANFTDRSTAQQCGWSYGPGQDLWQIAYIGPMRVDPCLRNAVVLPSVTSVTLVTGNE